MAHFKTMATVVNGWGIFPKTGLYGTDYLDRALITAIGLGANRPQDAVYPTSEADADGKPYDGAHKYVMHFDKGQMPPAKGFWSLTMYNAEYFFVANPLNRYTLSTQEQVQVQQGRLGGSLYPERVAGQGQGGQLAAGPQGQIRPDAPALLAEGAAQRLDHRRHLEAAGGEAGAVRETEWRLPSRRIL